MKLICFVVPYFGKLPNYFPLFLQTCAYNPDFNWVILTDDERPYNYPDNVQRARMTFAECQQLVSQKFPKIKVKLDRPYKLCDLKPMYGVIFDDYLCEFEYWGYCDIDTIMGNLGNWLTEDFLKSYDKIFQLGHMTIFKNTEENNHLFKSYSVHGTPIYQMILTTNKNMNFDEEWNNDFNVNQIFLKNKKSCYLSDLSFNVAVAYNHIRRIQYIGKDKAPELYGYRIEDYKDALYIWEEGNVYRLYLEGGKLKREDFLYMHFQNRKMSLKQSILGRKSFKITNTGFFPLETETINTSNFNNIKRSDWSIHTQRLFVRRVIRFLKKKMKI